MSEAPLVSVVVPVYNAEPYLRECLDSLFGQTLKEIEIIAVDDGSTDGSGKILDEFAARDRRLKVIHQENAGVSAARNRGIKAARGRYLTFVDADDRIDRQALGYLCFERNVCKRTFCCLTMRPAKTNCITGALCLTNFTAGSATGRLATQKAKTCSITSTAPPPASSTVRG